MAFFPPQASPQEFRIREENRRRNNGATAPGAEVAEIGDEQPIFALRRGMRNAL